MERTWMPTVAGILSIIAGAIGLLGGIIAGIGASVFLISSYYTGPGDQYVQSAAIWAFFLPYIIISIVAVVGGVYALQRRVWGLALAGAICALLTIWAWYLGIAAIVFIVLSRNEFDHISPIPPSSTTPRIPPASPPSPPPPIAPPPNPPPQEG